MINVWFSLVIDVLCLLCSCVFFWSTIVVLVGLIRPNRRHPAAPRNLRFAILVCARNEASVIRLPVKSLLLSKYPSECREVIVLADNCTDATAEQARAAGATVWEHNEPSSGKGDVLSWGIARVCAERRFDAIAVFDADNAAADNWLGAVNNALNDGETIVTGRRHSSNAKDSVISGWYTVYWDIMNELSNRVRTNLGLSGKLTGTGFAFLISALNAEGWKTSTLVEDVEFTVQANLSGHRVAYVPEADYTDEQPTTLRYMWRQLRRWTTGGWQVAARYLIPWLAGLCRKPSLRLFDCFFAILTGMAVAFVHLFNLVSFVIKMSRGYGLMASGTFFIGVLVFVCVMGWFMAVSAVALSQEKRRPRAISVFTFPVFSLILSMAVLYTLVLPTRQWKPIPHIGRV